MATDTPETPVPDGLLVVPRDPADPRVEFCRDRVTLRHSATCTMAFGKLDPEHCARCIERANERVVGLPARADHAPRRRDRAAEDARMAADIKAHFASEKHARECGPGGSWCTFGQW